MVPTRIFSIPFALALFSCAHTIDFGPTGPIDDPGEILHRVQASYERVPSLQAEGRLGLDSPKGGGSLRMALDVEKPGKVFMETADILGTGRGTFSTDGEVFAFFDPSENVFYTGPATEELLGRFLPIALPADEIAALLLGQPDLLLEGEMDLAVEEEGVYRIETRNEGVRQRIRVATKDLRLISVETRGRQAVDVELSEHRKIEEGVSFPGAIELIERRSRTRLRIRYTRIDVGAEIDEALFRLQPPQGATIHPLN